MTEEQILNIWDRYYKVDPSRKNTKYGESGLGLPIVQQLVRLHKGKLMLRVNLVKAPRLLFHFLMLKLLKLKKTSGHNQCQTFLSLITHVETGVHIGTINNLWIFCQK